MCPDIYGVNQGGPQNEHPRAQRLTMLGIMGDGGPLLSAQGLQHTPRAASDGRHSVCKIFPRSQPVFNEGCTPGSAGSHLTAHFFRLDHSSIQLQSIRLLLIQMHVSPLATVNYGTFRFYRLVGRDAGKKKGREFLCYTASKPKPNTQVKCLIPKGHPGKQGQA